MAAIDGGAKFYFQSDIQAFFTKIPTDQVINILRRETGDEAFVDLFARALEVHLANKDELLGYAHLFPKGGIGVAQGSSLSAFSGNVLLYDMDQKLNTMSVTAVRYIDDILMVGADHSSIDAAKAYAEKTLADFGFGLYTPADGSEKAAQGECNNSINFLSCTLQPKRCVPSAKSIENMKEVVRETLVASKSTIKEALAKGTALNPKQSQSAVLHTLGERIYGWQKSFAFCNQRQPFEHLDVYVAKQIADYHGVIVRQLGKADHQTKAMILGVPSIANMFDLTRVIPAKLSH
ncbi:reverse transcriptase (RNA-dependent DNA polymerase) [Palleronia aestuarii]|uniref:Reverse transcriptase (RNA-dependent DNA polymerase) n=1 Tax=Palleronia aestuarii TaxID=568105 RepID=A0A2W7NH17_9RHOB|nr:reverse transcriptase domain-containing protein [Palleronia aestuarii]PZX10562.1 reverse transcriptase (RNA-dependent DNA polymerase) [Palleronia aestuarii]